MLILRDTQAYLLGQHARATFVAAMCAHLRTHFPASTAQFTEAALIDKVHACVNRAAHYGLRTQRDVCRYLNLAAEYGWEFDRDPDLPWMRRCLSDESVSDPGSRLDRLVKQCLHRQALTAHNLQLRRQLAAPVPDASSGGGAGGAGAGQVVLRGGDLPFPASRALEAEHEAAAGDDAPETSAALPWAGKSVPLLPRRVPDVR